MAHNIQPELMQWIRLINVCTYLEWPSQSSDPKDGLWNDLKIDAHRCAVSNQPEVKQFCKIFAKNSFI